MKIDIRHNGTVIGRCDDLAPIDPPMGVAAGRFDPAPDYDPRLHAVVIEGERNDLDGEAPLSVWSAEFGAIPCAGIVIEDCAETLNERNVTLLGVPYPDYETFFASHASYKAYWRSDPKRSR
jgi:hypothetical protein